MANLVELSPEQEVEQELKWWEWLKGRPDVVVALGARFRPWKLYRMKSTGHRVTPFSFSEDGTMTVAITGKYNLLSIERQVFGIDPDDLEECELPGPEEIVGVYLTEDEQLLMTNRRRAEFNLKPLTLEEFRNYGREGRHMGEGENLEPVDRDLQPPKPDA